MVSAMLKRTVLMVIWEGSNGGGDDDNANDEGGGSGGDGNDGSAEEERCVLKNSEIQGALKGIGNKTQPVYSAFTYFFLI